MSELERLRQVWAALGCEQNPDDFKATVQENMWTLASDMIQKATSGESRVYRENVALEAELGKAREQINGWITSAAEAKDETRSVRTKLAAVEAIHAMQVWGQPLGREVQTFFGCAQCRTDGACSTFSAIRSQEPPTEQEQP